jgi:hypothetical protein
MEGAQYICVWYNKRNPVSLTAHFQQSFFGLNYRTIKSALKQMPDYLMPAIKVDRVGGLQRFKEPNK